MEDGNLGKKLTESIVDSKLVDIVTDLAEAVLDKDVWDNIKLFQDIPVINAFVGVIKTGSNIKERFFVKKIVMFLTALSEIPEEKRIQYIEDLKDEKIDSQKTSEYVMVMLERISSINKAKLVGVLYRNYLEKNISKDDMASMIEVIDNIKIKDFVNICNFKNSSGILGNVESTSIAFSQGLLKIQAGPYISASSELKYDITSFGSAFISLLSSQVALMK